MLLHLKSIRLTSVLIFGAVLSLSQALGEAPTNAPQTTAKQISHTSKILSVPTRAGTLQKLVVDIDDWSFSEDVTEFDLPEGVSAIMSVVNGRVSIVVAGVPKEFATGNYWSAPAGTHMAISIQAPARGAVLRTIIARPTK